MTFHQKQYDNLQPTVDTHYVYFLQKYHHITLGTYYLNKIARLQGSNLPSDLPMEPLLKPLVGNKHPVLTFVEAMLALEALIDVSIEDVNMMLGLPLCDIPGVGIIVPTGADVELTSCGHLWLCAFLLLLIRICKRCSRVLKFV